MPCCVLRRALGLVREPCTRCNAGLDPISGPLELGGVHCLRMILPAGQSRGGAARWTARSSSCALVRAALGRLSALSVFIRFVWDFCMGAQGA